MNRRQYLATAAGASLGLTAFSGVGSAHSEEPNDPTYSQYQAWHQEAVGMEPYWRHHGYNAGVTVGIMGDPIDCEDNELDDNYVGGV